MDDNKMWEIIDEALDKTRLPNEAIKSLYDGDSALIKYARIDNNELMEREERIQTRALRKLSEGTLSLVITDLITSFRGD